MIFSIVGAFRFSRKAASEAPPPPESIDFTALYHANFSFVWRTLRGLGVEESSVADAAQEVFVIVLRKIEDYRPTASMRSWIFGIARRVAKDFRRASRRRGIAVMLNDEIAAATSGDPHAEARRNQALRIVEDFADTLDEERRALFVLSELEEMSMIEIAEALKTNQNTLYSRLKLIKAQFERYLAKRTGAEPGVFP